MAKRLTIKGLERMIREEVHQYEKELEKKANATKEVDADEYADTLEKHEDHTSDEPKAPGMKTSVAENIKRRHARLVREEKKAKRAIMQMRKKRASLARRYKSIKRRSR
jgi:hypothetical protein